MGLKEEIIERESRVLLQTYKRQPVVFVRGEGCSLFDTEGKRYLDCVAGVAVNALGHSHPAWIRAVTTQAAQLVHTSNLFYTEPMVRLAEALVELSGMARVFFCNSGAEANEAAIKIARKWGKSNRGEGCHNILTFEHGFHGRTYGALSATAKKEYSAPFTPMVPGFVQAPLHDKEALDRVFDESVCGVLIEPVQGEAGVWPIDVEFLRQLRKMCDERGALLICDEVQTGIARTGEWFGYQHSGIVPDLAPLAKGLGGGFPIGACLVGNRAAEVLVPGDHGSTYAGSPLAATAALAVIQAIQEEGLLAHVRKAGEQFRSALRGLCEVIPVLDHVRGVGLMNAVELNEPIARSLIPKGLERGVVFNATGETTLRFVPPLLFGERETEEVVEHLRAVLAA